MFSLQVFGREKVKKLSRSFQGSPVTRKAFVLCRNFCLFTFFFKENKITVDMPKKHSSNQLPYKNKIFKQCVFKININRVGKNKYMYPSYLVKTQKGTVPY